MYYFIVTPSSRSGKGIKLWETIQTQLNLYDIPYQVIHTTRPYHATKLAKHLSSDSKPKTVIVLGGDGTLNERVKSLLFHPFTFWEEDWIRALASALLERFQQTRPILY